MAYPDHTIKALERIERALLPTATMMLDTLIDAAAHARSGDAGSYADDLRLAAEQLHQLTREAELAVPREVYRAATAA